MKIRRTPAPARLRDLASTIVAIKREDYHEDATELFCHADAAFLRRIARRLLKLSKKGPRS